MNPLNASRRKGGTPIRLSRLFITAIISMPSTVPPMEPLPPDMLVPPTTTAAIAYNIWDTNKFVCPIMDARRNQVYTGVYCYTDHRLDTVWEQDTMSIEALAEGLNCLDHEVIFLGDGVAVYREKLQELLTIPFSFAPAHVNRQRAAAVAALAEVYYKEGKIQTAEEHEPEYLRKSQAERERAERESVKHADVLKKQKNGEKSE